MLKGTRGGILKRVQPISIHGQVSWDIAFVYDDDPEEQLRGARIAPEAASQGIEPGDRVELEFVLGQIVRVTKKA